MVLDDMANVANLVSFLDALIFIRVSIIKWNFLSVMELEP